MQDQAIVQALAQTLYDRKACDIVAPERLQADRPVRLYAPRLRPHRPAGRRAVRRAGRARRPSWG